MNITWPSNTGDIIDDIRDAIGRNVDFIILASSSPCPTCSLDPITNTSTDSFCLTCSGIYWIPIYETETIKSHVTWGGLEQLGWVTGGQYFDGDCRLQIPYSQTNLDILDKTAWVVVDGKKLQLNKKDFRGVPNINRIVLNLIEND